MNVADYTTNSYRMDYLTKEFMPAAGGFFIMRISVRSNVDKLTKHYNYLERKQIPYAASVALNNTIFKLKSGLDKSTKQYIDRPTPFTQKTTLFKNSTKRNLISEIWINDSKYKYLKHIIDGTSETNRVVPVKARTNAYGNLPRTYTKTRKSKPNFFSGHPKGGNRPAGLWERVARNKKLKMHVVYKDSINHSKKWPYARIAKRIINRHFEREMDKSLTNALKNAR